MNKIFWLIMGFFAFLVLISFIPQSSNSQSLQTPNEVLGTINIGSRITFENSNENIAFIALSKNIMNKFNNAIMAHDKYELRQLIVNKQIIAVSSNTTAIILTDNSYGLYNVRITSGPYKNVAGYVAVENVKLQ